MNVAEKPAPATSTLTGMTTVMITATTITMITATAKGTTAMGTGNSPTAPAL